MAIFLLVLIAPLFTVNAWIPNRKWNLKATTLNAMTEDASTDLLPILLHAIPAVQSYSHLDNIVQGNAEGTRILARHSSSISETDGVVNENDATDELIKFEETELFLKRVLATAYKHKTWTDMRRTLIYLRTEVRFYNEFVPLLLAADSSLADMIPKCHYAAYNLNGLVDETSPSVDVNALPTVGLDALEQNLDGREGHILLQSLSPSHGYYQNSPISIQESLMCLKAVARMHASAWGNASLLYQVSERLSSAGGSYHLKFRNPKELQNIVSSWEEFRNSFIGLEGTEVLEKKSVAGLGQRLCEMAKYVSDELSPSVSDKYATLVHGDYKAMNLFLPASAKHCSSEDNNTSMGNAIMIDFSCVGIGYGLSDVAMHIVHAVMPSDLENGQEEYLVEQYILSLEHAINQHRDDNWTFPRDVAWRHYQLACIDYLRFIMGRFWKNATPESFEQKKYSKNTTLINRDVKAAMTFIEKVDRYLAVFERQRNTRK